MSNDQRVHTQILGTGYDPVRFIAALKQSRKYASEHENETRAVLGRYAQVDQAVINEGPVERIAQLAVDHGPLLDEPNLDELLP